jgi:peptide/nickel transport system substrate-binding protein
MFRKRQIVALIIVLVFVLSSCGAPNVPIGSEKSLRVGWTSEPDILNPISTYSTEALQIVNLIYEPLISYDTNLQLEFRLAESLEYSADGLTATYKLRQGVKWQDGEAFTSADVVGTYKIIKDNQIGQAAQYTEFLQDITAPDDNTVVMTFSKPQAFNLAYTIPILPMHIWGNMTAADIESFANDTPVGTGPMTFVEWQKGSSLTLQRNADYYGNAPGPAKIMFIQYGNEDILAQALKAGEVDIVTEVSPTVWEGLNGVENVKAVSLPSFSFHNVGINVSENPKSLGNPLLKDKVVRQALSYAMDRTQITEIALAGHGAPGATLIPNGMKEWQYQVPAAELMDNNIEKAQSMLEAAGYVDTNGDGIREKGGKDLAFRLIAIESTTVDVRAAQLFRDSAEKAGIKLTLTTMDENTMGGMIFNVDSPDFDLFVWGWDSDYADPGYLMGIPLTSQIGNNNDVYYSNPAYDELYSKQSIEMDVNKRKEIINEMQKMFYGDSAYLVLWNQDKLQAYRTDTWTGWVESPGGIIYNITFDNYINITPVE